MRVYCFQHPGLNYRLITRIYYADQAVTFYHFLTHKEYDRGRWKKDCDCWARLQPPPLRRAARPSRPTHHHERRGIKAHFAPGRAAAEARGGAHPGRARAMRIAAQAD
ncbi:MAG: type II toxin-antitoxin system HigB family toxin [Blastocatellia bacterium]